MITPRRNDLKTRVTRVPVEEFLATVTNGRRLADARHIIDLMRRITGEEPLMWGPSMIGFGSYHYRYDSGREGDTFVVGLSPRSASMIWTLQRVRPGPEIRETRTAHGR